MLIISVLPVNGQVSVEACIDSLQILVGEQTDLVVTVKAPKQARITFPVFQPSQYITSGLEVLDCTKGDTTVLDNDKVAVTRKYTLTSFDENLYYIPSLTVSVNGKKYKTSNLALKVLSIPVDTLHPEKFFPPKDVQDNPFEWDEWSSLFWLSVVIMILSVTLYYLWTRLKQNKPVIEKVRFVKHVPPHQKALTEIEQLKNNAGIINDNQKEYYTRLTDVLRNYIRERFGFNAMEMTSTEIILRLQNEKDKGMIDELKELFTTADLVKFAKYSALVNESDANLVNAIDFINTTKREEKTIVEEIKSTLSDNEKKNIRSRKSLKTTMLLLAIAIFALLAWVVYEIYLLF
ncbi:MAG: BatD family protein [Prevotella sp.]